MKLKVALDWTPNVIHAGLYIAQIERFLEDSGVEVEYISVEIDNYQKKTIQRLVEGEVHIALGPSEHLLDYRLLRSESAMVTAVATIMQQETSAFVTLTDSGLSHPVQLDGKTYGGYQTQLEYELLSNLIQQDGGKGEFAMVTPPRLEVFEAFLQQQFDVCWVFMPWEGEIAKQRGYELNAFHLHDYQIPYGYSPVLMTLDETLEQEEDALRAFLLAVERGYQQAAEYPQDTAKLLVKHIDHPNFQDLPFITQAMEVIAPTFLNKQHRWGIMRSERWDAYLQWLSNNDLLKRPDGTLISVDQIETNDLYTGKLLTNN